MRNSRRFRIVSFCSRTVTDTISPQQRRWMKREALPRWHDCVSVSFVKANSLPSGPKYRFASSDALDVATGGYSALSDMSVRIPCFIGYCSLFDQAGVVLGGAGHRLIKS
jgi:hypothetical protein